MKRTYGCFGFLMGLLLAGTMTAGAADRTWDGGGANGYWNTPVNWDGDATAPSGGDALFFGGSTRLANTNDLAASTSFNGITFNSGAGAFVITGAVITLGGDVTNSSASLQTLNLPMALDATRTFNTASSGSLTVGGVLSGAGGLTKAGAQTLTLSGVNTFNGGATLNAGKLTINNNSALGSGAFTLAGNGTVKIDTVSSPLTLANAQNWNADFTYDTGSGNRMINVNGNVTLGGDRTIGVIGSGNTLAVGGIIGGNFGLTVSNVANCSVSLTGANTYSGVTKILGGTLIVTPLADGGVNSPLGSSSSAAANLVIDGGTLQLNTTSSSSDRLFTIGTGGATLFANVSTMAFTNTGALGFTGSGARTLTLTEGNRLGSLAASITDGPGGATSLIKSGGSTDTSGWTLSGNNSYTGPTTLNGWGSLNLNSANALGNTSKINFKNTGSMSGATILYFKVAPGTDYSTVFSSDANQLYRLGVDTGVSVTLGGNLSSSGGSLEKLGDGTLALTGNNSYNGGTKLTLGTLQVGNNSALGTGGITFSTVTLQAINGDVSLANAATLTTSVGLTVSGSNNLTLSGGLTNSGLDSKLTSSLDPGKTLTLSGTTFLQESSASVGRILLISGTGNTIVNGPIVNGGIGGNSGLTINNTGTTTLNGNNTYSGTTDLRPGANATLIVGNKNALGSGLMRFASSGGTTLFQANTDLSGANALPNNVLWNSGVTTISGSNNITFSGTWTNNGTGRTLTSSLDAKTLVLAGPVLISDTNAAATFTIAGIGNTTISGNIANGLSTAGALTINNIAVTALSGSNTYSGKTTVSAGTLRLASANALPGGIGVSGGTSNLTVSGGAVIELGAGDFMRDLGSGAAQVNLNGAGGAGFSAYGAGRVVNLGGSTGTVTWGISPFIDTGFPLVLGSASATHTVDFQNPIVLGTSARTVQVNNGAAAVDAKISGAITASAGGKLVKTGAGTLLLTGNNTYLGATTVSNGTLLVNGGLASTNITVVSGAALGGTGTVALANLTMQSGSKVSVTINADKTCDKLNFTGTLDLNGLGLDVVNASNLSAGTAYTILSGSYSNTFTGAITGLPSDWTIDYKGSMVQLKTTRLQGTLLKIQ